MTANRSNVATATAPNAIAAKKSPIRDLIDDPYAFFCYSEAAKAVFLAGTFNDWDPTATPMVRDNQGHWTVSLDLAPGRYEYKFVVDGEWCCEPGCWAVGDECSRCVTNEFGTMNRVLEVE